MTPPLAEYIEAGCRFAPAERLEAARILQMSVDHDAEAEPAAVDHEWDAVIQRRVHEFLSETVEPVGGRESFARIRARLAEPHK